MRSPRCGQSRCHPGGAGARVRGQEEEVVPKVSFAVRRHSRRLL